MGYRVPWEWDSLTLSIVQRGVASMGRFKRGSRDKFLRGIAASVCVDRGCYVCEWELVGVDPEC